MWGLLFIQLNMTDQGSNLLIIGNGFDKSLNLKTGYNDFLNSEEFKDAYKDSIRNNFSPRNLFQFLSNRNSLNNWVDVELEIKKYIKDLNDHERTSDHFVNLFKQDYTSLKSTLKKYLEKIIDNFSCNTDNSFYNFYSKIGGNSCDVINFNYTNIFLPSIKGMNLPVVDPKDILNIHGTIQNNDMIFGVDEFDSNLYVNFSFVEKAYHKNYKPRIPTILLNRAGNLFFYGVSLGETDKQYFEPFFQHLLSSMTNKQLFFSFYEEAGYNQLYNRMKDYTNNKMHSLTRTHQLHYYDCVNRRFIE